MKAAYIERYGNNEVVKVGERPKPELRSNDLLIAVKAASVNPVDFKIRDGKLKAVTSQASWSVNSPSVP